MRCIMLNRQILAMTQFLTGVHTVPHYVGRRDFCVGEKARTLAPRLSRQRCMDSKEKGMTDGIWTYIMTWASTFVIWNLQPGDVAKVLAVLTTVVASVQIVKKFFESFGEVGVAVESDPRSQGALHVDRHGWGPVVITAILALVPVIQGAIGMECLRWLKSSWTDCVLRSAGTLPDHPQVDFPEG